jgi:hypothetical protein
MAHGQVPQFEGVSPDFITALDAQVRSLTDEELVVATTTSVEDAYDGCGYSSDVAWALLPARDKDGNNTMLHPEAGANERASVALHIRELIRRTILQHSELAITPEYLFGGDQNGQ